MICFVVFYQFTQQNLPACKPVLTPSWVSNSDIFCSSLLPHPPPPKKNLLLFIIVLRDVDICRLLLHFY